MRMAFLCLEVPFELNANKIAEALGIGRDKQKNKKKSNRVYFKEQYRFDNNVKREGRRFFNSTLQSYSKSLERQWCYPCVEMSIRIGECNYCRVSTGKDGRKIGGINPRSRIITRIINSLLEP